MLRKKIVEKIEQIMGTEHFGSISESVAKIGLRGLGINIDHGIESGGEDRLLRRLFDKTKGMACFDVGANVGDYTAALLEKGASKVAVFEPAREPFDRLQTRFSDDPRISAFQTALGEKEGLVDFYEAVKESDSVLATRDAESLRGRWIALSGTRFRLPQLMPSPANSVGSHNSLRSTSRDSSWKFFLELAS